jgi:lysyl-tRNA synthetase class 2
LPGDFTEWFPISVLSIVAIGVCWAATVWIRPWQQRLFPDVRRREQASAIVRAWGGDTLAPFTLRSDKEWFLTGQTLIAYRVIRGIALISGDPVGPPDEAGPSVDRFLAHAQARGWRTAVMGASDQLLQTYRDRGLHPLYHGDEAVIETQGFSLDGRPMRAARQAVHRLERRGFRAEVVLAGDVPAALRAELAAVEHAWLRGGVRKGFSMELDSLFRLDGGDAVFVIGRDEQWLPAPGGVPAEPVAVAVHHAAAAGRAEWPHRLAHHGNSLLGPRPRAHARLAELLAVCRPARRQGRSAAPAAPAPHWW